MAFSRQSHSTRSDFPPERREDDLPSSEAGNRRTAGHLKKAIIIGSEGQDGRLLFDQLSHSGWSVLGLGRNSARSSTGPAEFFDIASRQDVRESITELKPQAVFYLPAVHASSDTMLDEPDDALFRRSLDVHVQYAVNFLEAISESRSDAAFFYAGSSHVFAGTKSPKQNEQTPLAPESVYGITKAAGINACRFYRSRKRVRASVGFLYNHESHLRAGSFVSNKIVTAAIKAARGERVELTLADLNACVDWGYAPDYVNAMVLISQLPDADDYIIATGEPHSVREFVEEAFEYVGADWKQHVVERPSPAPHRSPALAGDYRRLHERTGWHPTLSFRQMVRAIIDQVERNDS